MMREIKFRAYDKSEKMLVWPEFESAGGHLVINSADCDGTLMQFTGLTDKNGVDIYEGDIVRCDMSFDGGFLPHMGEMVYVDEYGAFATKNEAGETLLHNHLQSSFEIIGNIHEDSHLLNT